MFTKHFPLLGKISAILLLIILIVLALIHIYWAFGGKKGLDGSIPTNKDGEVLFTPGKVMTAFVGLCLFFLAYLVFAFSNTFDTSWNQRFFIRDLRSTPYLGLLFKNSMWICGTLFFIRGIGDFKYAGLFKKIKETNFGKNDTRFFTPLCFFMAFLFFILAYHPPTILPLLDLINN